MKQRNPEVVCIWSSVEPGGFMHGLEASLRQAGYVVRLRYQVSATDYRARRSRLGRGWLRARMYLLYPIQIIRGIITGPARALHVVTTNTFYAPLLATFAVSLKRGKVVHLVYDLYPDVLEQAGAIAQQGITSRLLGWITRLSFRRSAANVFLGERLREHALARYGEIPGAAVIPVGAEALSFPDITSSDKEEEPPTLLYCGNFGVLHDVETLLALLQAEGHRAESTMAATPWLRIAFHSHGHGYRWLQDGLTEPGKRTPPERIGDWSISWGGNLAAEPWREAMSRASMALVTLRSGAEAVAIPSKVYSAMAAGQAILAICAPGSDLADLVQRHQCGCVIAPGDVTGLRTALKGLVHDPQRLEQMRRNAQTAARNEYDQQVLATRWVEVLQRVGNH